MKYCRNYQLLCLAHSGLSLSGPKKTSGLKFSLKTGNKNQPDIDQPTTVVDGATDFPELTTSLMIISVAWGKSGFAAMLGKPALRGVFLQHLFNHKISYLAKGHIALRAALQLGMAVRADQVSILLTKF
jgi:hypothetical protein